jgi:hypothetical protein
MWMTSDQQLLAGPFPVLEIEKLSKHCRNASMVPCFQDLSGIKINMQARAAELGGFDVNCSSSESPGIMKLDSAAK